MKKDTKLPELHFNEREFKKFVQKYTKNVYYLHNRFTMDYVDTTIFNNSTYFKFATLFLLQDSDYYNDLKIATGLYENLKIYYNKLLTFMFDKYVSSVYVDNSVKDLCFWLLERYRVTQEDFEIQDLSASDVMAFEKSFIPYIQYLTLKAQKGQRGKP